MDSREKAILKTLLYSDLFEYPLTKDEIFNYLIGLKIAKNTFYPLLKNTTLPIASSAGFFFLSGKKDLVKKRREREKVSLRKIKKAEKISQKIASIPTVKLTAISGSLAMKNSEENDDIDVFIVAEKNLVWLTRLLVGLELVLLGSYRSKNSRQNQDKICLNFLLGEERLALDNHDLFTAHEVAQVMPIFQRDNTYEKFLIANGWLRKILPNVVLNKKAKFKRNKNYRDKLFVFVVKILFLEQIAKAIQLFYMKKHITKERLEDGLIGLHPFDYRVYVLRKFKRNLRKFQGA